MRASIELRIGQRFGRFIIKSNCENHKKVVAICDCGKTKSVFFSNLKRGLSRSCGCLAVEAAKINFSSHGKSNSSEYRSWSAMRTRCTNKRNLHFKDYGGRGISICARWDKFENFYADMGPRPKGMTLDRKENNGNYEPGNCRWATHPMQTGNTRASHNLVFGGEKRCLSDWARRIGMKRETLRQRLARGWSVERSFNERLVKHV